MPREGAHPCSWAPEQLRTFSSPQPSHPSPHSDVTLQAPLKAPPPRCPAPCRLCPLASGVPKTVLGTWAPVLPRHSPPSRTHPRQGGHPIHPSPDPRHAPPLQEAEPQGAAQVFLLCGLLTDHAPGSHRQPGGRECKLRGEDDLSGRIIQHRSPARHLASASKYWWKKRAISQPGGRSEGSGGGWWGGEQSGTRAFPPGRMRRIGHSLELGWPTQPSPRGPAAEATWS